MDSRQTTYWKLRVLMLAFLVSLSGILSAKHIIFDLGGVLLQTSKRQVIRKAGGLMPLFLYAIRHGNPRKALFQKLEEIEPVMRLATCSYDEEGNELPQLFCDFLSGVPSENILTRIAEHIDEDDLLWQLSQAIFDPTTLAQSQRIVKAGESFVKNCIKEGHQVYILSNWDHESFAILQELHPEFFELFDGIIISGDCHLLKPDPAIYQYMLDHFNLAAHDCVFIDNQQENIDAAEQLGIKGIYCPATWLKNPNFKKVRRAFNALLEEDEIAIAAA